MPLVALAEVTASAGALKAHDDAVADRDAFDSRSHLLDDSCRFVPVDRREHASPRSLGERDVAVADRAGGDADPDLSLLGRSESELLDPERRAELSADRGSHSTGSGGNRDCSSRAATSIVLRVYCWDAGRDGWKSHGNGAPSWSAPKNGQACLLARADVSLDGVEIPAPPHLFAELAHEPRHPPPRG